MSEYGIRPHKALTLEESEEHRKILEGVFPAEEPYYSPGVLELLDAPTLLRKAEQLLTGQEP